MNTERTICFLMANLGSEFIRFFSLKARGDREHMEMSAHRARAILQQLEARKDLGNGKEEVALLKAILEDGLSDAPNYMISDNDLNSYFRPFAEKVLAGK